MCGKERTSDDRPKRGYGYEYLQKVASYTGWQYEYVYGTWDELYEKLVNGEIDLMASIAYSKEARIESFRAGISAFLTKPLDGAKLIHTVARMTGNGQNAEPISDTAADTSDEKR